VKNHDLICGQQREGFPVALSQRTCLDC